MTRTMKFKLEQYPSRPSPKHERPPCLNFPFNLQKFEQNFIHTTEYLCTQIFIYEIN